LPDFRPLCSQPVPYFNGLLWLAAVFASAALHGLSGGAFAFWGAALGAFSLFDQVLKLIGHRQSSAVGSFHEADLRKVW
jgi:hypothetical protein